MYHMDPGAGWFDMGHGASFWFMGFHGLFSWLVLIALVWIVVAIVQKIRSDDTQTPTKT